ncbi:nitronate monooxygenase [Alternaria panax]|uniref:Nitronate monooxygenase n=1 Tax=Alternaria panax TaxID=48097 RepID=A0AAD4IL82_9PLEO|nr:nitronate monooxygenase [Alternaria panax]
MAVEISKAGGIGFIGAGTDVSDLESHIRHAKKLLKSTTLETHNGTLPIGIGFINWGANLETAIPIIAQYRPAAVWFFAPSSTTSLVQWTGESRTASPKTKIWVQIGSVKEAVEAVKQVQPDVLVVQGTDAGGHGLVKGASIVTLLPEVKDTLDEYFEQNQTQQKPILLAAGGISEPRTFAAALTLGASGCILGTRLLATPEANITQGYRSAVLRTTDGGQSTVRTKVYDSLRGTNWAETHNARGIITQSYVDAVEKGMSQEENTRLYKEEMGKGDEGWRQNGGRMTTYAGSGVGLVREVMPAGDVVREVRDGVVGVLEETERRARL